MAATKCSAESHSRCKSSDVLWSCLTPVGVQVVSACSYRGLEMPGYQLALANCPCCDSTLARPLTPTDAEAKAVSDERWERVLSGAEVAA